MTVKEGSIVKVEYTGSFEDGEVFDSSDKNGQPLEVAVGSGQVIKGFEKALMGMQQGDEKEFDVTPAEGYGDVNPQLVQKVPKEKIPADQKLEPGMMLSVGLPNGSQIPATVKDVAESEITLDLNHPLAGKKLHFKIKVAEISA